MREWPETVETVGSLIEKLKQYPINMPVGINFNPFDKIEMTKDGIYAGARAIKIENYTHKYRIVELIKEKVNLLEDGLFFAVRDVKTGEMIGASFDNLRFGSRKRDKENEDFYTIDEWINANTEGYISDYDGSASFCDDEYVYHYPDPFNPNTFRDYATDCFSGVIFYGK